MTQVCNLFAIVWFLFLVLFNYVNNFPFFSVELSEAFPWPWIPQAHSGISLIIMLL